MKFGQFKILAVLLFLIVFFFAPFKDVSAQTVNVKCNCGTKVYSACQNIPALGLTNVKYRGPCPLATAGPQTCKIKINNNYYEYVSCAAGPTATPGSPTVTPGGPTPTVNPLCACNAANSCSAQCVFHKQTGITTYNNPIKCTAAATFFATVPNAGQKNDWCRRAERTKGDANGDEKVTFLDYFYYLSAKFGGKIPSNINPDFNGDGQINAEDRAVIIKAL